MSAPDLTPEEAATVERFEWAPDALMEDLRDEVAEVLQSMAEHVLRHMGFSRAEIERYTPPPDHEAMGCEFDTNHLAWQCYDEHGTSHHPDHDEAGSVVEIVRVALESDALLPLITQREAAARAEALRDAAREVEERIVHVSDDDVDSGGFETGMDVGCEIAYTEAARRLNERAARIARGDA